MTGTMRGATIAALACFVEAQGAMAQSITAVLVSKNAGNSTDQISTANPSYERQSQVQVIASTATTFSTRYFGLTSADSGLFGDARLERLDSDYTIAFSVTAPGAYRLNVAQRRKGDLHLVEDNILASGHYADMTGLTAAFSGGSVTAGSLTLPDPGRADDIALDFDPISLPFDQTASATISGVSTGASVAHSLTFTWSQEAYSPASGDEAAVRLGGTSNDPTETAADYPGSPARVQGDDGHFVTITLVSLCGNGALDSGPGFAESCDAGALNGTPGSCCTTACTPKPAGSECRPAAGACDVAEHCDGGSGACPADVFASPDVVCRAASAGQDCDVSELCDGSSATCPPDLVKPAGTTCRGAVSACDVAESCDGSATACPADVFAADGHDCSDGQFCNGSETCQGGICTAGTPPCVGACDEGGDACTGLCPLTAQPSCRTAERSSLQIKNDSDDSRDRWIWKWTKGAGTSQPEFGDPTASASYALCLYSGPGASLVAELQVPASSSKWSAVGSKGYKYSDSAASAAGARKIKLKSGTLGRAGILFSGSGAALPDPLDAAPLSTPVTVQLVHGDSGLCWQSRFSTPSKNSTSQFKAKQ